MQHLQWSLPIDIDLGLILHCRESSELDNTKRLNPSTDGIQINVVVQTESSAANYNVSACKVRHCIGSSLTLLRLIVTCTVLTSGFVKLQASNRQLESFIWEIPFGHGVATYFIVGCRAVPLRWILLLT